MVPLWVLLIIGWLGSWILISFILFIWYLLTKRLLKRRYKEENDRSRKFEGTKRGERTVEDRTRISHAQRSDLQMEIDRLQDGFDQQNITGDIRKYENSTENPSISKPTDTSPKVRNAQVLTFEERRKLYGR